MNNKVKIAIDAMSGENSPKKVIDGIEDNVPGELNRAEITGNTIILETERKEYLLFAHIKANSILLKGFIKIIYLCIFKLS